MFPSCFSTNPTDHQYRWPQLLSEEDRHIMTAMALHVLTLSYWPLRSFKSMLTHCCITVGMPRHERCHRPMKLKLYILCIRNDPRALLWRVFSQCLIFIPHTKVRKLHAYFIKVCRNSMLTHWLLSFLCSTSITLLPAGYWCSIPARNIDNPFASRDVTYPTEFLQLFCCEWFGMFGLGYEGCWINARSFLSFITLLQILPPSSNKNKWQLPGTSII